MVVVGGFITFVITILFMFALRPVAVAIGLVDIPGGRKKHDAPVPLIGGLAMSVGLGFGSSLTDHPTFWTPTILAIYLLVVVGTIDDRFDLPASVRLIAQACAAMLLVFGADIVVVDLGAPFFFDLGLGPFAVLFSILFIITIINAFNVIDGIDGLAGGLSFLSLLALAIIGFGTEMFVLTVLLIAVVAGFLLFNLPLGVNRPLRSFMGDAGSTFLGLAIAAIGIRLCQNGTAMVSPVIGLWLVAVPVFDLFSAAIRRVMQHKSPFAPDHEHLHHVLIVHGLSPRSTFIFMLGWAAVFGTVGVLGDLAAVPDGVMLIGWFAALVLYYQMMRRPGLIVRLLGEVRTILRQEPI
jgi:UDP-GlcNAc:undecaprenyl-phosphate GlcNAc-1-phosphate transferase